MDFKETDRIGNYQIKQYHQNYGYDLEKELAKRPIKELTNEQDKTKLMESLKKGNRQAVTFVKEGGEQKMFIEAAPKFKAVNVYDSNMQRLSSKQTKGETQAQGESNTAKQGAKKESRNQGVDLWKQNDFTNPIPITRKVVMTLAHIHSIVTYHKCIMELQEFGYIEYVPNYNPYLGSSVTILLSKK